MIKHGSVIEIICQFQVRYEIRLPKRTFQTNYFNWRVHATVHNLNKGNSSDPKTGRTEANINMVRI